MLVKLEKDYLIKQGKKEKIEKQKAEELVGYTLVVAVYTIPFLLLIFL